jgi:hypothetical protein
LTDLGNIFTDGIWSAFHQSAYDRGTLHDSIGYSASLNGLCAIRNADTNNHRHISDLLETARQFGSR